MGELTDVPEQGRAGNQYPAPAAQSFVKRSSETPPVVEKKEIRRPLKPKDILFIEEKVKDPGISNRDAAMKATGLTNQQSAAVESVRMLKNANLREALDEALVNAGISLDKVIAPVVQALEYRTKTVEEVEITEENVDLVNRVSRDDLEMRLKGHDRAIKLIQIANGGDEPGKGNTFNFNFNNGNQSFVRKNG